MIGGLEHMTRERRKGKVGPCLQLPAGVRGRQSHSSERCQWKDRRQWTPVRALEILSQHERKILLS